MLAGTGVLTERGSRCSDVGCMGRFWRVEETEVGVLAADRDVRLPLSRLRVQVCAPKSRRAVRPHALVLALLVFVGQSQVAQDVVRSVAINVVDLVMLAGAEKCLSHQARDGSGRGDTVGAKFDARIAAGVQPRSQDFPRAPHVAQPWVLHDSVQRSDSAERRYLVPRFDPLHRGPSLRVIQRGIFHVS